MSLRTAMLNVIETVTNVLLPAALDQYPYQVTIVTRTYASGAIDGSAAYTDSNLVLPQKYPIRQVTTQEVTGSGGLYEMGDVIVEMIVPNDPANPGVGFTPAQLAPRVTANGTEVFYSITGQHKGEYALRELRTAETYEYQLVLSRRVTVPEVTAPLTPP